MGSLFNNSDSESTEENDESNECVFQDPRPSKKSEKNNAADKTEENDNVDDETNVNREPAIQNIIYGYPFKDPSETLENLSAKKWKIVRDGIMLVPPDFSDDDADYNIEDYHRVVKADEERLGDATAFIPVYSTIRADEGNPHNHSAVQGEEERVKDVTEFIPVHSAISTDGMMSSRPKTSDEYEQTFPEQANNIANITRALEENSLEDTKETEIVNNSEQDIKVIRINRRALPKDADTYRLENFKKNAMIVFNQINIDGYEPRKGTKEDFDAINDTFSRFGFEIDPHEDLRRDEIFKELKRFSAEDFTDYGCVAVVILTHGSDMGSLRAKNRRYYESDVISYFKTGQNPTLVTKPILIIIQACRGKKISKAKIVARTGIIRKDTDDHEIQPYTLPLESDMMVLHSTYPGNASLRNESSGSWFIQTLCSKIDELAATHDLDSIMTVVKRVVAIDMEHEEWNRGTEQFEIAKQMPVLTSTLIRKLYLRGYEENLQKPELTENVESEVDGGNIGEKKWHFKSFRALSAPVVTETNFCNDCLLYGSNYFNYLKETLRHFVEDSKNSEDTMAQNYLTLAQTYKESDDFYEAKIKLSKIIMEYLNEKAKHHDYYKFLYLNKDT